MLIFEPGLFRGYSLTPLLQTSLLGLLKGSLPLWIE